MLIKSLMVLMLLGGLMPSRGWFPFGTPLEIDVEPTEPSRLVLTDFAGKTISPLGDVNLQPERSRVDLRGVYPQLNQAGTYLLYLYPADPTAETFLGTPLVINVRQDRRAGASPEPMVVHVEPLRFVTMQTTHGELTLALYYDSAPHTVNNFIELAGDKFYDGLGFHRIVPGFILQGGDPRGDGTGGPAYTLTAEFGDRPHKRGVVSLSRQTDPDEGIAVRPRTEFADTGGSQFFICLDTEATKQLDGRYAAFAEVVTGMDVVDQLAATPVIDQQTGKPAQPIETTTVSVHDVTAAQNPYAILFAPTAQAAEEEPVSPTDPPPTLESRDAAP